MLGWGRWEEGKLWDISNKGTEKKGKVFLQI